MTNPAEFTSAAPRTGIDRLLSDDARLAYLRTARTAMLSHDACHTGSGIPTRIALAAALGTSRPDGLVRLFTPEHGLAATARAGDKVADGIDAETGLPIVSLYGPRLRPDPAMLADLDAVVVDLRDVGVRCFTYAATAAKLIAAAAELRSPPEIIVCDRPNPLGPRQAGPKLDPALRSFVAWFDTPFVHGRNIGELLVSTANRNGQRIEVISSESGPGTPAPKDWIAPSPALDHPQAVRFYPGLVLLEGANLSEGRGTSVPFRSVGAPWLDTAFLAKEIPGWHMPVTIEQTTLEPTQGSYAGARLPALVFGLGDETTFDGLEFGTRLMFAIARRHPEFAWTRMPERNIDNPDDSAGEDRPEFVIDALLGSRSLREAMDSDSEADALLAAWSRR